MPTSRDIAIFMLTTMTITTMTRPITLPLAYACGIIISSFTATCIHQIGYCHIIRVTMCVRHGTWHNLKMKAVTVDFYVLSNYYIITPIIILQGT